MLAIKFYIDTEKEYMHKMIDYAVLNGLGLEFQMLRGSDKKLIPVDYLIEKLVGSRFSEVTDKLLHLNNYNSFGADISNPETLKSFEIEGSNANKLKVKKVVMHYSDTSVRTDLSDDRLKSDVFLINNLAVKYDITIYIENTIFSDGCGGQAKANVDFYSKLFDFVIDQKLSNIGFCLDLGHAKVFSDDNFSEWETFLDKLQSFNIPLHFHLHNNDGTEDDHLSFHIAETLGLNNGDNFTGGLPYLEILRTILSKYQPAMHVMEIQPKLAFDEIEWLKVNL